MSLIVLYFLRSTSVLSSYIDVVLTLSICNGSRNILHLYTHGCLRSYEKCRVSVRVATVKKIYQFGTYLYSHFRYNHTEESAKRQCAYAKGTLYTE